MTDGLIIESYFECFEMVDARSFVSFYLYHNQAMHSMIKGLNDEFCNETPSHITLFCVLFIWWNESNFSKKIK